MDKYNEIADKYNAPKHYFKNSVVSFLSGGFIGALGEGIIELLMYYFQLDRVVSSTIMIMIFIVLGSILTGLTIFDKMVSTFRCGLIIPITGFAHSMTSSFMDYRKEGLVYGIGSNAFKLAGTVIVYGVVSACFVSIIHFIIGG